MEEDMLESNVDLDIIIGRAQQEMMTLTISNHRMTTPTQNVENTTIGRGIFHVQPPNV
jgi:hypothetical protein